MSLKKIEGNCLAELVGDEFSEEEKKEMLQEFGPDYRKEIEWVRKYVYGRMNDEDIKQLVKGIQRKVILEDLPTASEKISDIIHATKEEVSEDKDLRELQYKASVRVMESSGVLNSNSQSIYINQLFAGNNMVLTPQVEGILSKFIDSLSDETKKIEDKGER
jgi:hypothetical protein